MIDIKKEKRIIKSASIMVLLRPVSVVISLIYTPMLLGYLGDEQYGLWATLLSVMNWFTIFDFGISGGFRNILSVELVRKDIQSIRAVTSTAYVLICTIVSALFCIMIVSANFIDWFIVFNTSIEMQLAVIFVFVFICCNFIFGLSNSIFYAKQQAEVVPLISVCVQIMNCFAILILSNAMKYPENRIPYVAFAYMLSTVLVNVAILTYLWKKNSYFIPSFRLFDSKYIKSIFSYGIKLFFIQISGIILFTTDNMIITQLFSANSVTVYSITRNVFNVLTSVFFAILSPTWSRYTVENAAHNYKWIRKCLRVQLLIWIVGIFGVAILSIVFRPLTMIWLNRMLEVSDFFLFVMGLLIISEMFTAIYSNFLNGISHVNKQVAVSLIGAILNIPLSVFFAKTMGLGISGICMGTLACQILGCIVLPWDTMNYIRQQEKVIRV